MHKLKNALANTLVLTACVATIGVGLTMAAAGAAIGALVLLALRMKGSLHARAQDITPPMAGKTTTA